MLEGFDAQGEALSADASIRTQAADTKMARIMRAIFSSNPVDPNLVAGIGFEPMTFRL
jgi:hypothetical protein